MHDWVIKRYETREKTMHEDGIPWRMEFVNGPCGNLRVLDQTMHIYLFA